MLDLKRLGSTVENKRKIGQLYIPNLAVSHILYGYGGDQISSSAEFPLIDKCQYH